MQITIKPSVLRRVAGQFIDQLIFHEYTADERKMVTLPKRRELIDQLLADEKFMRQAAKYLSDYVNDEYVVSDAFCDSYAEPRSLNKYIKKLDKAREKIELDSGVISVIMPG